MPVYFDTTDSSLSTNATIWSEWTCSATTGDDWAITNNHVWTTWSVATTYATTAIDRLSQQLDRLADVFAPQDAAAQAEAAARAERRRVESEQAQARQQEATRKARALLDSFLSEQQRQQLQRQQFFEVIARGSRTRYRIHAGAHGNIERLDSRGRVVAKLCCHVKDHSLPDEDHMLIQRLMLEHNEDEFVKTANVTPRRAA